MACWPSGTLSHTRRLARAPVAAAVGVTRQTIIAVEQGRFGLGADSKDDLNVRELPERSKAEWRKKTLDRLKTPRPENVFLLRHALQLGVTIDELYESTKIDRWFLHNMKQIVDFEDELYSVRA